MIELPPLPLPIEQLSQVGPLLHAIGARKRILQARIAELQAENAALREAVEWNTPPKTAARKA